MTVAQPYTCGNCGTHHADLSEHCPCIPGPRPLMVLDKPKARREPDHARWKRLAVEEMASALVHLEALVDRLRAEAEEYEDRPTGYWHDLYQWERADTVEAIRDLAGQVATGKTLLAQARETIDGLEVGE